jgi:RNA polymerase sigma factor (sigma-70 family)
MLTSQTTEPTAEERRQAVCLAMTWAPGLIRFAARYTTSIDDAEDAYQRAMEIALTSAPDTEPEAFVRWLYTIIRREAGALARTRRHEEPRPHEALDETMAPQATAIDGPDAVAEWRERYRSLQDAWTTLTEAQRVCVLLRSHGVPRHEIQAMTGFSDRKIRRAIEEGRARLNEWEVRMTSGQECAAAAEAIERAIDHNATRSQQRRLERHIKHCRSCRASFRARQEQTVLLGSLVPPVLVGALTLARPPDPGLAVTWWERVSTAASARSAHAYQTLTDIPAAAAAKAGAGAVAAAAATLVGAPVVADALSTPGPAPLTALTSPTPTVAAPPAAGTPATPVPRLRPVPRPARSVVVKPRTRSSKPPTAKRTPATGSPAATTHVQIRPRPSTAPATSAAMEFGP